jgi:hypothetical protein
LYENLLVATVSQFEAFLTDVLSMILRAYPGKLSVVPSDEQVGVSREQAHKSVPLDTILKSGSYEGLLDSIIEARCQALLFARPRKYIEYISSIASFDADDEAFQKFMEIKASRDVVIHNRGIANPIYVSKSEGRARAESGEKLEINAAYFDDVVTVIKRMSGIIAREAQEKFGKTPT